MPRSFYQDTLVIRHPRREVIERTKIATAKEFLGKKRHWRRAIASIVLCFLYKEEERR